ncbi:hypothetical protein ABKN59_002328 [Abortiporus biennis]
MTRRPLAAHKQRPLSAIFIGSIDSNTTSSPPPLPEPPSPSASSNGSGLPSPPATNSTGSGSVGDNSQNGGSLRKKTASRSQSITDMFNGTNDKSRSAEKAGNDHADDEDVLYENDEEHTARLSLDRKRSSLVKTPPNDNLSALQRVKSLTQRNRMVLDKLTSISRMSSPAPTKARSPYNSSATSPQSSEASSSRHSSSSSTRALQQSAPPSASSSHSGNGPSGSETEREPRQAYGHSYSSSDSLSATPTSSYSEVKPSTDYVRPRQLSAPSSPARALRSGRDRDRSPGPTRTPRKRASMQAATTRNRYSDDEDNHDVTTAALAAIASSRRSPTNGRRTRNPLPKEFRDKDKRSLDGGSEPPTPHRNRDKERERSRRSPSPRSPRTVLFNSNVPPSPRRLGVSRFSTVREEDSLNRSGNSDMSYGRRQGHRAGSSDGPLSTAVGRTLLGEGLRAAGLTRRREEELFGGQNEANSSSSAVVPQRTRSNGNSSVLSSDYESPQTHTRLFESGSVRLTDPRTPAALTQRHIDRSVTYSAQPTRPGTSMAALHSEGMPPPRTAPGGLRTYRTGVLDRDRDSPSLRELRENAGVDRTYSPFGGLRSATAPLPPSAVSGTGRDPAAEHRRLMLEALTMFESHLSRLPPMGQTTTSTIPEVFQNTQHLVHSLDKLNTSLRSATNRALESQIDAEIADYSSVNLEELWSQIGSEYRESLRMSDEVVRSMTGFLLGVGKVLREATSSTQHMRTMSLDEEVTRRLTPDASMLSADRNSSDGRRSRRSWDPREVTKTSVRSNSRERIGLTSRPGSSMNMLRGSATSSSEGRSVGEGVMENTPETSRTITHSILPASRRLYTPHGVPDYEPSPTPASRIDRNRALPPIAIPPSLPTLPSESLLRRSATSDKSNRRKISSNSNITVRAEPSTTFQPISKPPTATTALTTHTVSISPDSGPSTSSRDSGSARTNHVTFSRSSTISASTLSSLAQKSHYDSPQLRMRSTSTSSSAAEEPSPVSIRSPMSGSETERPRTFAVRAGRVPLDSRGTDTLGSSSQASTLVSSRKERRKTITEIFSQR